MGAHQWLFVLLMWWLALGFTAGGDRSLTLAVGRKLSTSGRRRDGSLAPHGISAHTTAVTCAAMPLKKLSRNAHSNCGGTRSVCLCRWLSLKKRVQKLENAIGLTIAGPSHRTMHADERK